MNENKCEDCPYRKTVFKLFGVVIDKLDCWLVKCVMEEDGDTE